ncbi:MULTISPECIES: phage holin family protein [Bacillus]|uniref:Holin n=1 Tax=Bacillus cereus TaxID=1396 RepID=A0A9X6XX56_BACCE|nr:MULTISPECIES: phage holin family protein [Bacillus]KAB2372793.1 phage holin family protein [Bacillus sp. RM2(2019)]KXY52293.1 holin [Bacillus cereus]PDZ96530.1 holin [Bacillus cereus]PFJ51019.1 holin [Bacillus thuringiensis]PGW51479.1 holin [Bacillus thuringiensis]
MNQISLGIKSFIVLLGTFCGYFLGGWDIVLITLTILTIIDYITGIIAAAYNGELKSKIGFRGIAKKVVMFLLVGVAVQLDLILGSNSAIREATIFFFSGNELLSILENAGRMGVKLPDVLVNAVEILNGKKQRDKKGDDVK